MIQKITTLLCVLLISINVFAAKNKNGYLLLPQPKELELTGEITKAPVNEIKKLIELDTESISNPQGYEIEITSELITIKAATEQGLYYAKQTLRQLSDQTSGKSIDTMTIRDYPDFPVRGVMLDISRDKVPTMQTLFSLIEMLSSWKINHIQLYTEHTFAYKNHREVWKDASPMTADQIRILDSYCKQHFIDLVPNQNSFGHMERWLKHESYRHLAEAPDYVDTKWGKRRWHTLYPADPCSIALIEELYDELLPNFSSKYFNVGCDETIELGNGRSKELCEKIGTERVYLDFLLKISRLVEKHDKTMMFWADMIQHNPDIIKKLPSDAVAMIWGYDAKHPFGQYCKTVAYTGCDFYVCPGTSTWISLAGRTDNAFANLLSAAQNGLKYGAKGFVNTDWGDLGNFEPITTSYPAYAYGAAISWRLESNKDINIPEILDEFIFMDKAKIAGKTIYNLGNAYKVGNIIISNSSIAGRILLYEDWDLSKAPELTAEKLQDMKTYTNEVIANIDNSEMQCADAEYIKFELRHCADLINHACDLGIARLGAEDTKTVNIPLETRQALAKDIKRIIENHKTVWLRRNREGGLSDSLEYLQKQLALYESVAE
ncbi:MAG: family 20 glycosylhydrolase [Sedimentisphaeraceae bacterium JB056]